MTECILNEGWEIVADPENADIIVINTCSFIQDAYKESAETITEMRRLKEEGQCKGIVVSGCLPQRYSTTVHTRFPFVDAFLGPDHIMEITNVIKNIMDGQRNIILAGETPSKIFEPSGKRRVVFSQGAYAYLKIAEGCNHFCSFCTIPSIRGRYRSRSIASIVREAENLLSAGFRELNLISQDTFSFGYDTGETITDLLRALSKLGNEFWIRLLYGYPCGLTEELLNVIAESDKICRYFDIPIQHASEKILKLMNRSHTVPFVKNMTERIRKILPNAVIRTTCITGFPGETNKDFEELHKYIIENQFDHLGVFVFSPEKDTKADSLPNRVTREEAEKRREILMLTQHDIMEKKHTSLVGKTDTLLVDSIEEGKRGRIKGRTMRFAPEIDGMVYIKKTNSAIKRGSFVPIIYTKLVDYDMEAEVFYEGRK